MVFLHGLGYCRLAWANQVRSELSSTFRLVTVDLRGHGGSDAPPDGYADSSRWAQDVAAVLGEMGLHRPVVVGWSYAGAVICDYLAEYGDDALAGLVLVGAVSDLGTRRALDGLTDEFVAVSRRLVRSDPADLPSAVGDFVDLCTHRPLPAEQRGEMRGWNSVVPGHVLAGMLRRTLEHDATLRAVRVPTLVLHGEADRVVRVAHARHVAGLVPGARLVTLPEVGHMPFWEAPERFNTLLAEFVEAAGVTHGR
ncbi:MAG TPA: alpha/beta hydrolase [Mycobacteriales bacterium]